METGGNSAIQIILWILAANAILILSASGLVYWLKTQTRGTLQKIAEQIQGFDQQMGELRQFLQSFASIDQEPFFTPLEELQSEADLMEIRLNQFLNDCHSFEEEINQPGSNQLQNIINAPFIWFRRWQQVRALRRQGEETTGQMQAIENRMEHIYELPWELALECRLARKEVRELTQNVHWLQTKAVRGMALNKVVSQIPMLNQELENVPVDYFQAEKDALLASTSLETTIHVSDHLHVIRPTINRYLPQVKDWRASYERATTEYASLKQEGANLRQAFANPPPGLVMAPLQERLDQVAQMASELNQRLSQPEAETLRPLAREISHLRRVLQDTGQQFTRASQQLVELTRILKQLQDGLENLSTQFAAPEKADHYPLVWDESRGTLNDLNARFASLGPIQQPRTPEQIHQQCGQAEGLLTGYKLLAGKAPLAIKQHAALVELLNSQPIQEGRSWMRETRVVIDKAGRYDPRNWPKNDSLQTFPAELNELDLLQTSLAPPDPSAPLQESQLEQRLKNTQRLVEMHKALRPRAENIRARLDKIQTMEKEGKEQLTGSWNVLERVAILAESNTLLDEITSTEIDRLGEEIRTLANELNAHQQGDIEKKFQKIQAQSAKVNQALSHWLIHLNEGITRHVKKMTDLLIQVDAIASLADQSIEEARGMLKRDEIIALRSSVAAPATGSRNIVGRVANRLTQPEGKPAYTELEAMAEIKRKNDLWQTLLAVQTALEELSRPLLAANLQVVEERSGAKDQLAELEKKLPDRRVWPPSNQTSISESQGLSEVDGKREELRKRPVGADWAVRELARLAREYRLVSEHARQVLDRTAQDQERVQELEWQINSLKERWQSQIEPENPIMRAGVQQLISQSDLKLEFIKQQYMQGVLSYEQVIRNLQLLYDEIFIAQVPVDEQTKVRLNEPHHRTEQP